jgi:ubiquinone/menaquinone biosynthesis C-methylase UbiE
MNKDDLHLGTGDYEPAKYWEARAKHGVSDKYQAVCAYGLSHSENWAMDRVQSHKLLRLLKELDLKALNVLELGCGVGRWAPLFQKAGTSYTGADISEGMLDSARRLAPGGCFVHLTNSKLPFDDESFDLVFTVTVLHHNPYERQNELIDELLRVTKHGGYVLLIEDITSGARLRTSFNMFPRPVTDWVSQVKTGGRAELIRIRFMRYWIIKKFIFRLVSFILRRFDRVFGIKLGEKANALYSEQAKLNVLRYFIARLDGVLDPVLNHGVTEDSAIAAGMLFQRSEMPLKTAKELADVEP